MKPLQLFYQTFLFTVLFSAHIFSQGFNIDDYLEFLQQHQNMSSEELLQMHPAGVFVDKININLDTVLYFDSIKTKYNLTEYEESLISDHGFMVTERLAEGSFGEILLDIHHNDLPVFVSADAILYAFHASYDRVLKDVELGYLIEKVSNLFTILRSQLPQLAAQYSSQPEMFQMLRDVDVYLTVGAKLIGQNTSPYYIENTGKVSHLINRVLTEEPATDTIFSSHCISYDWSQFKPRGHYDYMYFPELKEYFRTMMWLGRIEIYLIAPPLGDPFCDPQTFKDIQRQCIDAVLMSELFDLASAVPNYDEIEDVIKFFVGDQDNVTLPNLYYLRDAVGLTSASELLDSLTLVEFQDTLANQSFANQLIQSQILKGTWSVSDSIVPASSFLLFGQRYVDDSYVTAHVVYDRIRYNNQVICRLFPSTLDPIFALGNDAAAQLLITELNQYHYATNLAVLRYLFDAYTPEYWNSTFYRQWLNAIRTLNPPNDRSSLPLFMQTAAFWQEKLNTQLSSWAELRHDNLLYAKQSYTGYPVCSFPYSYVEPFTELYEVMIDIGAAGYNYFQGLDINPTYFKLSILEYFSSLQSISDTLRMISAKELSNTPLSIEETNFLKDMIFQAESYTGDTVYNGWYPRLIYDDRSYQYEKLMGKDYIVADIHTTPADCGGGVMGWIKHVGTGPVDVGVFIAQIPGGEYCAFVGPLLSYHDYTTEDWLRLTDDEWASTYLQSATRPDWVNLYLADSLGQSRGTGGVLITSVEKDENPIIPQSQILLGNYPNPFNPYTIISFSIPFDLTNSFVELKIYNINGELVNTIVRENLPAGNYLTKWFGDNSNGEKVSSGVYIYSLRVGDRILSEKMTLLK